MSSMIMMALSIQTQTTGPQDPLLISDIVHIAQATTGTIQVIVNRASTVTLTTTLT